MGIRPSDGTELPLLVAIEAAAAARFADVGIPELASGPTLPRALIARQHAAGLVWVWGRPPIGFSIALDHGDTLHLLEVSVAPTAGQRGRGRALVEAVIAEAGRRGRRAVTLTTFRDVPFNRPFYAGLGFEVITGDPGSVLRAVVAAEHAEGLDRWPRVVMRLTLPEPRPPLA